jgi:hypothetical protein
MNINVSKVGIQLKIQTTTKSKIIYVFLKPEGFDPENIITQCAKSFYTEKQHHLINTAINYTKVPP